MNDECLAADSFHTQKKLRSRLSSSVVRFYTEIGRFVLLSLDDHRLILKRVVYYLLVIIEFFSLDVTAEELWANIG